MAIRRMIHQDVICCDDFLDMDFEAQALFFQLQIKADEYGFVQSPRGVLRMMGASEKALDALVDNGFVFRFHSGIIVMTHWNMANTRRSDREAKIRFPDEYNQLFTDETGKYYVRGDSGMPMSPQREPIVTPSISISRSPSSSPSVIQAEAVAAASASASAETRARTREDTAGQIPGIIGSYKSSHARPREDTDALLSFLYSHGIRLSMPEIDELFKNGFDLDAIFWMIEKTESAHPASATSYFKSVWEDKLEKKATTIGAIREAECDSPVFGEIFDKHVKYWQEDFERFKSVGAEKYAQQNREKILRLRSGLR